MNSSPRIHLQSRIRLQLKVSDISLILSRLDKYASDEEFSLYRRLKDSIGELSAGDRKASYTPSTATVKELDLGFSNTLPIDSTNHTNPTNPIDPINPLIPADPFDPRKGYSEDAAKELERMISESISSNPSNPSQSNP